MKISNRNDRIEILNKTLECFKTKLYECKEGTLKPVKLMKNDIEHSIVYLPKDIEKISKYESGMFYLGGKRINHTTVNTDSFSKAIEWVIEGKDKVLVLNFANPVNPGGGVRNGARAQEEDLCRKSSLLLSLESNSCSEYYKYNKSLNTYMGSDAVIITPKVEILRDKDNDWLDDSVVVSVITCAAPMTSKGLEGISQKEYEDLWLKRIQSILKVAAYEGYKNLVLGAFGCGAFGNDAKLVSDLFYKALKETKYDHFSEENVFDEICFAVLDNTDEKYNFNEFARNFNNETYYKSEDDAIIKEAENKIKEREAYLDTIRGCMIGGAAGDALGYPVEFYSYQDIVNKYGIKGITEYKLHNGKALVSDDTQMSLFTANGVNFAITRAKLRGIGGTPSGYMDGFYTAWLETQEHKFKPKELDENGKPLEYNPCWLFDVPELYSQRAPGNCCLTSLKEIRSRKNKNYPYTEWIRNDSKGCGALMRVAPMGLAKDYRTDFIAQDAAEVSAITHCHPLGYIPSSVLVYIINRIVFYRNDDSLKSIILEAQKAINKMFKGEQHLSRLNELIERAVFLAENSNDNDAVNIKKLGEGWVAEETLAIALYCSLKYQNDFSKGIIASVNHSGDSDSAGAVTGNILGAWLGFASIDDKWKKNLELYDVIIEMADDLCRGCLTSEFGRYRDDNWQRKYVYGLWKEPVLFTKQYKSPEIIGFYHEYDEYGEFSNWYKSDFEFAGIRYSSLEQYMMYQKATMFNEYELAQQIMEIDNPAIIKNLGRSRIRGFDSKKWDALSYDIVKRGLKAKFSQNSKLLSLLLSTGDAILMECSPKDTIWGIGLDIAGKDINNPSKWNGQNKLGRALMEVRDILRIELKLNGGKPLNLKARGEDAISEWNTKAGVLMQNPKYCKAIATYSETLGRHEIKSFLFSHSLEDWDIAIQINMGGGLPIAGFYEMKQEIYEIAETTRLIDSKK